MSNSPITQQQFVVAYADYVADLKLYAEKFLQIRTKRGSVEPFKFNKAQKYIHKCLETQKRNTGKVRALILKGRQQGCSTYVSARFYHLVTHNRGKRVFILTHESEATTNLFDMVNRYNDLFPEELRATMGASNAKELTFSKLDSGYKVGTAGNRGVGRSSTVQYLHGSEVAFWQHADEHAAGLMQAVPDERGTEVILESTANGLGNVFHQMVQDAMRGESEYQLIFIPWFWQDEYTKEIDEDFKLTDEEKAYQDLYGVSNEHLAWRRAKIKELGADWLFKQEYPANPQEAFQFSGHESFITSESIMEARKHQEFHDNDAALIIGVDIATKEGEDSTAIAYRRGRVCDKVEVYPNLDLMEVVGKIIQVINGVKPAKVFLDSCGVGFGVLDRLKELGYGYCVTGVNSAIRSDDKERYANKRAEMWGEMKAWIEDLPNRIPDSDELHAELAAPSITLNSNGAIQLEKKEDMKKRGVKSPDMADALALTFAFPVPSPKTAQRVSRTFQASIDYDAWA